MKDMKDKRKTKILGLPNQRNCSIQINPKNNTSNDSDFSTVGYL